MERALKLYAHEMIEERVDSKGKKKFVVRKAHHPKTGNLSRALTEFSAADWNDATMDYLASVKGLGKQRLKVIFEEAKLRVKKGKENIYTTKPKSSRSVLCSDDEDEALVYN